MSHTTLKVLAVEDDEFMKIFLKDAFGIFAKKEGEHAFEFTLTPTVNKAEEILSKHGYPDVVLLDLSLPLGLGDKPDYDNGFNLLEKIRSKDKDHATKVFIFSGHTDKELKDRAKELGADKYFVKGEYLPKDLLEAIKDGAGK